MWANGVKILCEIRFSNRNWNCHSSTRDIEENSRISVLYKPNKRCLSLMPSALSKIPFQTFEIRPDSNLKNFTEKSAKGLAFRVYFRKTNSVAKRIETWENGVNILWEKRFSNRNWNYHSSTRDIEENFRISVLYKPKKRYLTLMPSALSLMPLRTFEIRPDSNLKNFTEKSAKGLAFCVYFRKTNSVAKRIEMWANGGQNLVRNTFFKSELKLPQFYSRYRGEFPDFRTL